MTTPNGHFLSPPQGYGRPSPPTARRRIVSPPPPESAEPDRAFVDNAPANEPTLRSAPTAPGKPPEKAGAEVAAKKKARKPRASAEQREIAIARVQALVKAGETRKKAIEKVAKELGYGPSALNKWMIEHGARLRSPRSDRVVEARIARNGSSPEQPTPLDSLEIADALIKSLGSMVRVIVREEIRRMLS